MLTHILIPYLVITHQADLSFLRRTDGQGPPWLHEECQGSEPVLPRPAERVRTEELKARLVKLQAAADQKRYDTMVHDVTQVVSSLSLNLRSCSCSPLLGRQQELQACTLFNAT